MRRLLLITAICLFLALKVSATDLRSAQAEIFDTESLWTGLDDRTADLMSSFSPLEQADFSEGISEILSDALDHSGGYLKTTVGIMFRILAVMILCRTVALFGDSRVTFAAGLASTMAITVLCSTDINSMMEVGRQTIDDISSFTTLLLPVLSAAAAASGGVSSSTAIYGVTALFCDILVRLCRYILLPFIYALLAMGVADAAMGQTRLTKLRELIAWIIKWLLKGILYMFTGFLAATGVISGTADAAALKAAKMTISGMVPVVGGIVSDASTSLMAGAGLLKSAIGTFGMLSVLAIFSLPFFKLGIAYLGLKMTAALSHVMECGQDKLLDSLSSVVGLVLAAVGSCTVISLISCFCLVRVSFL